MTIIDNVPFKIDLNTLIPKKQDIVSLTKFYNEYEFKMFLKEISNSDDPPSDYSTILSLKDLNECLEQIKKKKIFAIDLETTSLDPNLAKIVGISLAKEIPTIFARFGSKLVVSRSIAKIFFFFICSKHSFRSFKLSIVE